MPTYSFGEDSPIKFNVSDKTASRYNEAVKEFFAAQQRFVQKFGKQWDPTKDPIAIRWSRGQRKAWNEFAKIFNKINELEGPFHVNDILDDYLVKNTVSDGSRISRRFRKALGVVAFGAVLYGLLKAPSGE